MYPTRFIRLLTGALTTSLILLSGVSFSSAHADEKDYGQQDKSLPPGMTLSEAKARDRLDDFSQEVARASGIVEPWMSGDVDTMSVKIQFKGQPPAALTRLAANPPAGMHLEIIDARYDHDDSSAAAEKFMDLGYFNDESPYAISGLSVSDDGSAIEVHVQRNTMLRDKSDVIEKYSKIAGMKIEIVGEWIPPTFFERLLTALRRAVSDPEAVSGPFA